MDKYEKLNSVKEYVSIIEEDVLSSCKKGDCDKDTLMTKNILECLKAVSGLLEDIVLDMNPTSSRRFFITDEQQDELKIMSKATVTNIANEINRVTENNNTSKIATTWITDWLLEMDILHKNDFGNRVPTKKGTEMGIMSEKRITTDGKTYLINLYPKNVQKYIYDNIRNIIYFYNSKNKISQNTNNFQIIIYPKNMTINKFIAENKKENIIIMSVGSCNTDLKKGSYKTVLIYQKLHKVIKGDIITHSADRCILHGIKEATEAIKKPSDIMIISPTLLGFGKRKSANYDICKEIIDILANKNCNTKIVTCEGMGFELRNYINILSKEA